LSAIPQVLTRYSANNPQFPVNDRSLFTGTSHVVGGASRPNNPADGGPSALSHQDLAARAGVTDGARFERRLLQEVEGAPVWLAPPILQEVLQGADSPDRFARWNRVLGELPMVIAPDAKEAALSAALLYPRCRWAGITPSANDCLIAMHAVLGGMPLLHRDRNFDLIAGVELKLVIVAVGQ
jgi:predicted nucleic acid-binding protein